VWKPDAPIARRIRLEVGFIEHGRRVGERLPDRLALGTGAAWSVVMTSMTSCTLISSIRISPSLGIARASATR
jgi:hypothetical protein